MTIGGVIDEAWRLSTRFFARFVLIAAIVFGSLNAVYALFAVALERRGRGAAPQGGTA